MKRETLKIKDEFYGEVYYQGLETAPRSVDGDRGNYLRHRMLSEKHGFFDVITGPNVPAIEMDVKVKIVDGLFYPDRSVNGRSVSPSLNVYAKDIVVVK
ncbi:TPA: cytoplasmic protein [Streptococcus suis]|uniref:cytoplasmic protein n=1 Tax=Streptococcus suis TaxID=1307 RepID=UPI0024106125|nr:cytoplasmic protein [Streptococcus suis]MDG3136914.1 cytoplasmic protein [Streptococcus suis]HEM3612992.1 cytoplasmic protein [Streptococcus suis]HEM3621652.1 cytoplasmic protein [Streptococcus suis]HEM3630737.1 cytoplasmic protein [Streptococcus suis]HEM3643497.1 cytoplasmic protein [Streptococcus suis]